MRLGFDIRSATILVLGFGAGLLPSIASSRDKPPPPPPCPLTATLRIADAGSLAGVQSLVQCGPQQIVTAPASPADYVPPANLEIAPDRPAIRRAVVPAATPTSPSGVRVAHIRPKRQEPVDLAAAPLVNVGPLDAESILSMRPASYTTPYDAMIGRVAQRHRVDPLLLHAVISQESRYRANATSPVGARGLMQLMPGTARELGVRSVADAESNVDGGARLLRRLHQRYGDFNLTLAAYNAGEGAVRKYGNQVPPYPETQNYVRAVMANYNQLVSEQSVANR